MTRWMRRVNVVNETALREWRTRLLPAWSTSAIELVVENIGVKRTNNDHKVVFIGAAER